jgi:ABC-type antimicrobial peptide transport system permease subunit
MESITSLFDMVRSTDKPQPNSCLFGYTHFGYGLTHWIGNLIAIDYTFKYDQIREIENKIYELFPSEVYLIMRCTEDFRRGFELLGVVNTKSR